jgi:hypothetical protein
MKTVTVDADSLRAVLEALRGRDHEILELKVVHSLNSKLGGSYDPVGKLMTSYNEAAVSSFKNPSVTRAKQLMMVAATYIRAHGTEGLIKYDGVECDGECLSEELTNTIVDLENEHG